MNVLLKTVTVKVTQTLAKRPTAILTARWTVTFIRIATACMNISVEGERQHEVASDFLYPSK